VKRVLRSAVAAASGAVLLLCSIGAGSAASSTATIDIRGQAQTLHTYGARGGEPVIVSSGDGGWIHLGPHIAEILASHGYFVVGFDVRSYLTHFTSSQSTLRPEEVPADYQQLTAFAAQGSAKKPVLIGVSEGAGLSVLAAADSRLHQTAGGVVGVGLPVVNELGWRWRDSVIYLTHGVPNEPTFSTAPIIARVAPLPLASIHSTHDEFVSPADEQDLVSRAATPKRLWVVPAADHRFSDNLGEFDTRLLEALAWIREQAPR
jgi:alpha-beta hydrolase superfamily lysophospholipase